MRQIKRAEGFRHGGVLADRRWTFWTMTAWDKQEDMRRYMTTGAHKSAMPKLMRWCDEASVAHWEQAEEFLPGWAEADHRMRTEGRISKVRHPSPEHTGMNFAKPRLTGAGIIQRVKR